MELNNGANEEITTTQAMYDSFNDFIFSEDTKVLAKLLARAALLSKIKDIPGDIAELGVFKGSGIMSWLKLKKILYPGSFRKVLGFDFFDTEALIKNLNGKDKERMENLFKSRAFSFDFDYVKHLSGVFMRAGFDSSCFELIKGDVSTTTIDFVNSRPGAKIALLYMDVDLGQPTFDALTALWSRVSKGVIIVFDEYGYHQWSESIGADRFAQERGVTIKPLDFMAPTAYIVKE